MICGMLGGCVVSLIHGFLCIKLSQNQSVSGIALNIFMLGVTSFGYRLMSEGQSYQQIEPFATIKIPLLGDIPLIGDALFNQDILTYCVYVLIVIAIVFYKKTAAGLAFSSIGEHPASADAAGISVYKYQWIAIIVNGILGGIGGCGTCPCTDRKIFGEYGFRTWLYRACGSYSGTLYAAWKFWRSACLWRRQCASDPSSGTWCAAADTGAGNAAVYCDADRAAWFYRKKQRAGKSF